MVTTSLRSVVSYCNKIKILLILKIRPCLITNSEIQFHVHKFRKFLLPNRKLKDIDIGHWGGAEHRNIAENTDKYRNTAKKSANINEIPKSQKAVPV